ncbi:hypothetical protein NHQ30_004369 [Ciborinia camelliae]|nr:hypothetical protein NHQ30_004369 [Ciborinia camelliae]
MFRLPSSYELFLERAKQEFWAHQQRGHHDDTKRSGINKPSNSTQNCSKVRITGYSDSKKDDGYINETLFDSCCVSRTNNTVESPRNRLRLYNSCTASNRGRSEFGQVQQAENPSSISNSPTNTLNMSASNSRKCLNAGLRDIMSRHLGLHIEVQDQHDSAFMRAHARTISTSSHPSSSSSFASPTSTNITTPVHDQNIFDILNWEEVKSPTQPIPMPNSLRDQELSAMARDGWRSDEYREDEEVKNPPTEFVPSAILRGERRSTKPEMARRAAEVGISVNPNYKGELTNFNLRNAMCLDHENCAVRIHYIHPEASHPEIFSVITHGKVFSFNYIAPMEKVLPYAAADLAFVTREAAEEFFHDANFGRGIYIRDQRIKVLWNRVKVMPAEGRYQKMSRVIRIKGPADDFSVKTLEYFFRSKFEFDLIHSEEWSEGSGRKIVELGFSSIRSQSESAMKSFKLHVDQNMPNEGYSIWYASDPCTRPSHGDKSRSAGNWR